MKPFFLIFLFSLLVLPGYSQYSDIIINKVTINNPGETISASVKPQKGRVRTDPDKQYTWYSAGKLHVTQGGFSGKLLNGPYSSWYEDKNLKEKGEFRGGLRQGTWNTWAENGVLRETVTWWAGVRDGKFSEYDSTGKLLKKGSYRNGLLHGDLWTYVSKDSSTVSYYRNGKPAVKKKIKLNVKKLVPGFLKKKDVKKDKPKGEKRKIEL
ncbi:toxin-antitoxin system YwqK family antitoxin [Pararcticibacter amylolyticus]|uniref:Toxin-antitoxin system YwqK family antitoxin n=1 Tax=Pararcticibacter amylolyticus TaxID=2173175 RepID=A0A2U2P9J1_9SPHI|nr:hypothetical protein [Pararcticibacter amylolyticus]PWG78043.1 hypothetical protein DDR33_24350 [Pararcticibacter amylolyticus]